MNNNKLVGVNLGGWLVLERWMTPSIFKDNKATDEYTLCQKLGANKKEILRKHRNTFITEKDFKWIAENGLNSIRLPIGHWIFGGFEPFESSANYVDKALKWASKYNLQVILDLHTAPGSQNGLDHSGRQGAVEWYQDPVYINQTVDVINKIAQNYGKHPSVWGIELLNEPSREIPLSMLQEYYKRAYAEVRKSAKSKVKIIMHDAYRPLVEWQDFIKSKDFTNVLLDTHMYQTFGDKDKKLNFEEHVAKTFKWKHMLEAFGSNMVLIGEWSGALDNTYNKMSKADGDDAKRLYIQAQKHAFNDTAGYMYWNFKTENKDDWNYKNLKEANIS